LGEGIVLDFTRFMNGLLEVNPGERWARVAPGLLQGALNKAVKPHKLFFPVDPSTKEHCTIAGMIANNSSGPHAVKYGATRDNTLSLEAVLANGDVLATGPVPPGKAPAGRLGEIYRGIGNVLASYRQILEDEKPFTMKNSSGYDLWRLEREGGLDLTSLFVGSEGTLGIITEAKVKLWPLPGKTLGGLVYFNDLEKVGPATQRILEFSPTMLEIIERRILDLAREQKAELRPYLPEGIEAVLFIEFEGEEQELRDRFARVEKSLKGEKLAVEMKVARDPKDMAMLEKVRAISGPILNKTKGAKRPLAFIEDAAVHPSRLPQYIQGLREIFRRHEVDAGIYGHAGDGNMHLMVFLDLRRQEEVRKMVAIADAAYDLVLSLKGTISGEHGDGRLRTYYTRRQYPKLYPAFVEIKKLFDPENLFNPGVIVGGEENPLGRNLKFQEKAETLPSYFTRPAVQEALESCSGCGKCRSYCPVALEVMEEWVMGRAKATLIREYLAGTLAAEILDSPRFKEVLDSCVNCKRCLTECPSGSDIPWVAVSGRAFWVDRNGEPFSQKILANTRFLCETGSTLAPLSNMAASLGPVRWAMEKAIGLDRRRRLPSFQRPLRHSMERRPGRRGGKPVAYFLSCYSNFNDPEGDGRATVEVLERNGFEVLLPEFRCCGIARLSSGAFARVESDIRHNVRILSALVEKGVPVIFSEPSCALAVKMEYPKIIGSEEGLAAPGGCYDIHEFLMKLHQKGELNLEFGRMDLKVGYHNPCHLRALGITKEAVELLRLIPGVAVQVFSDQCCGIAGTFGLKKKNYDLSMAIGEKLFQEIGAANAGEIVTSCGACKMQIAQGTGREAIPPIALLARAYGAK
jgi:anaerobic glycerol-3-phosphate dehydrogenase C subunit